MTKNHRIAMLSALIAQHRPDASAYTCAETALKMSRLSDAWTLNETFSCNGFKTDYHDELFRKNHKDVVFCNALAERLNREGEAAYKKRRAQLEKRLEEGFAFDGLSGVVFVSKGFYA